MSTSSPKISPLVVALQFSQDNIIQLIEKKFTDSKKSISSTQSSSRKKGKKKKNLRPSPQTWKQILDKANKTVASLSEITHDAKSDSKADVEVTPASQEKKSPGKLRFPVPDHTPSIPSPVVDDAIAPDKTSQHEITLQSFNFRKFPNIKKLQRLAGKGNTQAQLQLGRIFSYGLGVVQDNNKAMQWLTQAARFNDPAALFALATCKLRDDKSKDKYQQAFKLFELSASQNYACAQWCLAKLYFVGNGVKEDRQKAAYWFQLAANQGLEMAQYDMGNCFGEGWGVEKDLLKAREYYEKATAQNYPAAQAHLGFLYMQGIGGPQDVKAGIRLIKTAAELGDSFAQKTLGLYYKKGIGVDKDETKAIHYFELAAAQGEEVAEYVMARRYWDGVGVPVDLNKAISFYTSLAGKGNQLAQLHLAKCYYQGIGVQPDLLKAYDLFKTAAAQGNEEVKASIQPLLRELESKRIIQARENKASMEGSIRIRRQLAQTCSPLHTSASTSNEQTTPPLNPYISVSGVPTKR